MSGDSRLLPTFARAPLAFERGEGVRLYTQDGTSYLDFAAGIAVNSLGHCHPHLVSALSEQANKLWHVSNMYQIPEQERLAQRLSDVTFADYCFFTNSGAEALECAIKLARKYQAHQGKPERFHIITFEGAFHGRTLATLAAGGQAKYLEGFGPKVTGFDQVPFGDMAALKAAINDTTAALLIEPVQGEGGVRPVDFAFLRELRALCDAHDLLLMFDEVQTGVGRTGELFAYQLSGVIPDVMAIAKGIGGGFPFGACLSTLRAGSGMTAGTHGSTFGGNPLAMAVGNAVLDLVLEPDFLPHVKEIALYARQALASLKDRHPHVIDEVRGEGLLIGLRLNDALTPARFVEALREVHLLTVGAGDNTVRLLPPLIVTKDDIDAALACLEQVCGTLEAELSQKTFKNGAVA